IHRAAQATTETRHRLRRGNRKTARACACEAEIQGLRLDRGERRVARVRRIRRREKYRASRHRGGRGGLALAVETGGRRRSGAQDRRHAERNGSARVSPLSVSFMQLPHAAGLAAPDYASADAAGMDIAAAVPEDAPLILEAGARAAVPTGLILAIPQGYEGQVRPRSGLALKHAVTVLNAPGTIDADYRGEVKVILVNLGSEPFEIARGMRIAQLVIAPV